jgi:3D (Asp-Asp-Asp) domain-containing protein
MARLFSRPATLLWLATPALLGLAGCAQAPLGGEAKSAHVGKIYNVRTTAYTGRNNALSQRLKHGPVISAASDWSRFPVGTRFRMVESQKEYIIDDYGSAMVGTRTIDLCMPHDAAMHRWGVRMVDIEILEWGSPRRSLEILSPRTHAWYVRKMVASLHEQAQGLPEEFYKKEEKAPAAPHPQKLAQKSKEKPVPAR